MSQENNFIPEQGDYKPLSPFKLFVKSNFPFIENTYEALDNYGLYCKIVEDLNNVIENENTVEENVSSLYDAFVQLNTYVSDYFDNLDVQEEINNKLDDLVEDGTMAEIILPILNQYEQAINQIIETQNNDIAVLKTRMDTFTHLTDGSTSGDAELADGRISYEGFTYSNIGDNIRNQTKYLNKEFLRLNQNIDYFYDFSDYFEVGNIGISNSGWDYSATASTKRVRTKQTATINMKAGDRIYCDSTHRMIIGIRTGTEDDYTYTNTGWLNNAYYEFRFDCEICMLVSNYPDESNITSIKDIFLSVYMIRKEGLNQYIDNLKIQNNDNIKGYLTFDNKLFINGSGYNASGINGFNTKSRAIMIDWFTAPFDLYIQKVTSGFRYAICYDNSGVITLSRFITDEQTIIKSGTKFKIQISKSPENTSETLDLKVATNAVKILIPYNDEVNKKIETENSPKKYFDSYSNFVFGYLNSSGAIQNLGSPRRIATEQYIKLPYDIKLRTESGYYAYVATYNDSFELLAYQSSLLANTNKAKGYVFIPKNTYFRFCLGQENDTSSTVLPFSDFQKVWFEPMTHENNTEINYIRNDYINPIFLPSNPPKRMILHRGNERVFTENSIPAFESGAQIAWGMETDVRETSDGVLICMHDYTLNRTTNVEEVLGEGTYEVEDLTYSQIESLSLKNIPAGYDDSIPTFDEYLQICKKNGCIPFVEIKTDQFGANYSVEMETFIAKIIAKIKAYGLEQSCVVMNGMDYFGNVVRKYSKIITVVFIRHQGTDIDHNDITTDYIDSLIDNSIIMPATNTIGINKEIIQYAHSKNHLIFIYTISSNQSPDFETWIDNDCDMFLMNQIITS